MDFRSQYKFGTDSANFLINKIIQLRERIYGKDEKEIDKKGTEIL